MENVADQWYFTKEHLANNTPSRKFNIDATKELSYRQQAANFIQDMGQRLQVSQLCINTAIVYMHRFYCLHSFTEIHRNNLSVAALFLAAKVEEQPRKLEHVIKVAHVCLHKDAPPIDVRSEGYAEKQMEVVTNESILLQTLGFALGIEHPHTYVVKLCQMVKACKDLAQTSYFMATTSLHMTTMCLLYKPTLVAAVCIHLACKWSSWKIEPCSEGKEWYYYVDKTITIEQLESLTQEFIAILENSPHRFKKKFISNKQEVSSHVQKNTSEDCPSKHHSVDSKVLLMKKDISSPGPIATLSSSSSFTISSQVVDKVVSHKVENSEKHSVPPQKLSPQTTPKKMKSSSHSISIDVYREKKEKERLEQKAAPHPVEPKLHQVIKNKPQHALSDQDRANKHASNSVESHSSVKERANKSCVGKDQHHQVHSASALKANHHFSKKPELVHSKDNKVNISKISASVSNDPVVLLERVDMKSEGHDGLGSEIPQAVSSKLTNTHNSNYPASVDSVVCDSKELTPPTMLATSSSSSMTVTKSKHHKHKTNSFHSNHNSVHPQPYKRSPEKDIKTNGSKETDICERRNSVVENNVTALKTPEVLSKNEKREKYKSKHSFNSSKDKVVNSESLNPAIKVKIRKEVINKLPEKSPKLQSSLREESPKKSLKIKITKPPVPVAPAESAKSTTPLKLVITKDKSGSGSYCTSHKNERESRKRAHSPTIRHEVNSKNTGEVPSKHAKLDHVHSKQSKARHSSSNNVSSNKLLNDYHNVDVDNYAGQSFYGNQYYPYQVPPPPLPPPPPPPPAPPSSGYRGKTNYNHYLPSSLPPPSE